jgi:hypothetical protein
MGVGWDVRLLLLWRLRSGGDGQLDEEGVREKKYMQTLPNPLISELLT